MSLQLMNFDEIFYFQKKSKRKAGDGEKVGDYPFYTSSPILSKYTNEPDYNIQSLVFGTGGSPSVHITPSKFSSSGDCLVACPKDTLKMHLPFVFYFFLGNMHILEAGFKGAGLKHISKAYISNIKIPLPPLALQKQIAAVLEKADTLRSQCRQMEQELNILAQSVFLDMFGDPVTNPKGWNSEKLSQLASVQSGATPSKSNELYWSGNYPWVSPKDMKSTYISDSIDHISEVVFEETNLKKIAKDTILVVVRGMILAHTVPIALTKSNVSINQDIKALFISREEVLPLYLLWCLKSQHCNILQKVSTAAHGTKRLDMPDLVGLDICVPPIEFQQKFVSIIQQYDAQLSISRELTGQYQSLFESLMQRAFKGELQLKDVA
ncbi:restriction endonuclease subunit S [Pseudoalteromonas sp. SSMSWG5]|uniref:restriction endonuclease subunit S n=1 Tax=Pseudoalteromonas sp. SSMSWG5 TaxID=3139396 RepID=UPI003BAD7C43